MALKRLIGLVCSAAAGCQYCVAHNAHGLELEGVEPARQQAVWEFETSPLFTPAERAALRVARGAGQVPNGVTEAELADLREHFTPRQVAEIVAVTALFGFLNRWNATLRVALESAPREFAAERIARHGWRPGPHGPG
jgi:AhpD family alkylhydroperoxidase